MIMRKKMGTSMLALLLIGGAFMAVPASAGHAVNSRVTIRGYNLGGYHGRVTSRGAICKRDRRVWLVGMYADGKHPIEYDNTDQHGRWQIFTQLQGATAVRALASPKRGVGVRCRRARSRWVSTGY
jgi:hypothetical protein